MNSNWKECKLTDIIRILGGGTPKTTIQEYWNGNIPWLSVKDFNSGKKYVYTTEKTITELGLKNSSTQLLKQNDIIISARGTIGELAVIPYNMAFNQSCYGIRAKENVDKNFLYYLLKNSIDILKHNTHGSVFDTITRETFDKIIINLPPLETQQKIAKVLSAIDDKIELNNKINENLEQQALAIFKSWFVNFEPFDRTMPADWKIGTLGDIADICSGKRPLQKENCQTTEFCIPILGASSVMGYTNKHLYNDKILITGRVGTHGIIQKVSYPCWASDNTLVITSKYYEFTYQILKTIDYNNLNRGSTQPLITQTDLKNIKITIPNADILNQFEVKLESLMKLQQNLLNESKQLTQLLNTLLPKLMSGEIDVENIDIIRNNLLN